MFSKRNLMLTLIALSSVAPAAFATSSTTKVTQTKPKENESSCSGDKSKCYWHSRFQIGPYLNKDRLFDGSELIINIPSMREDARLLLQEYKVMQDCAALGIAMPKFPRMTISGKVEGLFTYTNPYVGKNDDDFTIDAAELDLYVQATKWLSAYAAIDYDPTRPKSSGHVFMNRAFVTLGNLAVTPFYVSAGKMYVPFGRYSSSMVSSPLTLALARTRANAVVFGYQQTGSNALHAEGYLYQGITHYANDQEKGHVEGGGDVGYAFKRGNVSGEVGSGVISNLADSQGFNKGIFKNGYTFISQRIPAVDFYGSIAYKQLNLLAEYIKAMRAFNQQNVGFANHGAEPSAFNTELSYGFKSFHRPSSVGVGFSHTSEAIALSLPKNSYRAVYNINIWKDTNLAVEYRHDVNYSVKDAQGTSVETLPLNKSDNVVSVEFDFFF